MLLKKLPLIAACAAAFTLASCGDSSETTTTTTDSATTTTTPVQDTTTAMNNTDAGMAGDGMVTKDDAEFVLKASESNTAELELLKSGQTRLSNADLKKAATEMIADHTKMGNEMKTYASGKNYTMAAAANDMHKQQLTDLNAKKGADYDKAWQDMLVDTHEEAVSLFEANNGKRTDAALNTMINDKLPVLKHHLEMAKGLEDKVK